MILPEMKSLANSLDIIHIPVYDAPSTNCKHFVIHFLEILFNGEIPVKLQLKLSESAHLRRFVLGYVHSP